MQDINIMLKLQELDIVAEAVRKQKDLDGPKDSKLMLQINI